MVNVFHPPESVIASWPKPNYVNPENEGPAMMVVGILLTVLGCIVVCVRIYARIVITRAPGIDDVLIVFAAVFAIILTALNIDSSLHYGLGLHVWDISLEMFVPHRIRIWASMICTVLTKTLTKISVLLFYRRISAPFSRKFLVAVWIGIVYNILYCVGFLLAILLICRPIDAFWWEFSSLDYADTHSYTCGRERTMEPLIVLFSVVSDLYAACIPMVLVFTLDLPASQKRALYLLFGIAFSLVITGFVRVVYIYITLTVTWDFTWTLWKMWLIAEVEIWVAICVASAPALKPFVKRLSSRLAGGMKSQQTRSHTYADDKRGSSCMVTKERNDSVTTEEEGLGLELGPTRTTELDPIDERGEVYYCARAWTAGLHNDAASTLT